MELFDAKGCLSEEGLQALVGGQLDETQRLEAAEHLAYCDRCMDRYTALLTDDVLEQPPRSARGAVMGTIWIRLMQNTWGRAAVATVAAVLALTLWRAGTLEQILHTGQQLNTWLPQTTQQTEPELLGKPVNDKAPQQSTAPLGKPIEDKKQLTEKLSDALDAIVFYNNIIMRVLGDVMWRWGQDNPVFRAIYLMLDALPQIVVCVALIVCGMWLVRGPKNKKGKQPAEEEPEDFHAYTAAPQAEDAEDAEDTADTDTHFAMPELSALLGEPVTGAEQDETPAEDDDDRAE